MEWRRLMLDDERVVITTWWGKLRLSIPSIRKLPSARLQVHECKGVTRRYPVHSNVVWRPYSPADEIFLYDIFRALAECSNIVRSAANMPWIMVASYSNTLHFWSPTPFNAEPPGSWYACPTPEKSRAVEIHTLPFQHLPTRFLHAR